MKGKYKMTGCARFFIFLIILAPIAYFGSKYLRDSGTWDKIKDKVESREDASIDRQIEEKRDRIDIPPGNSVSSDQFDKLRAAYEEQELILARQEKTITDLRTENDMLRKRLNEAPASTTTIPPPTRTNPPARNSESPSGSPSLDDLLSEADRNLGTSSPSGTSNPGNTGARESLATWTFSFSGTRGEIEFYRQGERLMARTTYTGNNRVDISELSQSGDRLMVENSPTGEYYVLRQDGDLDAFDRTGLQVTCRRSK